MKNNQEFNKITIKTKKIKDFAFELHSFLTDFTLSKANIHKWDYYETWFIIDQFKYQPDVLKKWIRERPDELKAMVDEKVKSGYNQIKNPGQQITGDTGFCQCCYDEDEDDEDQIEYEVFDLIHAGCYHYFSRMCYNDFLVSKIKKERPGLRDLTCMMPGCNKILDYNFLSKLPLWDDPHVMDMLRSKIGEKIVRKNICILPCKFENCEYYLDFDMNEMNEGPKEAMYNNTYEKPDTSSSIIKESKGAYPAEDHLCLCSNPTCIACEEKAHEPQLCTEASQWRNKLTGQMEKLNMQWIMQNTRQCPYCGTAISKNGACPHMTCSVCKNAFCWLCGGKFSKGEYYHSKCGSNYTDEILNTEGKTEKQIMDEKRLLELKSYLESFAAKSTFLEANVNGASCLNLQAYVEKNRETNAFEEGTLIQFMNILEEAIKLSVRASSYELFCVPLEYAITINKEREKFQKEQKTFRNFLTMLTLEIEDADIAAIFEKIDKDLYKREKIKYRYKCGKVYKYKPAEIEEATKGKPLDEDYQQKATKKMLAVVKKVKGDLIKSIKKYRSDDWRSTVAIDFRLE